MSDILLIMSKLQQNENYRKLLYIYMVHTCKHQKIWVCEQFTMLKFYICRYTRTSL